MIESVQRRYTLKIPGMANLRGNYLERLRILNLNSLQHRRCKTDLEYTYRIFYGLTSLNFETFFKRNEKAVATRGNNCKLFRSALVRNLDCRRHSFANRVIPLWNKLPNHVVEARSLSVFKKKLEQTSFTDSLMFP